MYIICITILSLWVEDGVEEKANSNWLYFNLIIIIIIVDDDNTHNVHVIFIYS